MGWGLFWAIFSHHHLVTLLCIKTQERRALEITDANSKRK
jgi:hypothetical protein